MKTSQTGLDLIKKFEGLRLTSYYCPANVLTIGYGHTGSDVKEKQTITKEQAEELLKKDLERFEKAVNSNVKIKITQNQFDALVSFTYNVGIGAFQYSTLLRLLNQGKLSEVPAQFMRWNKGGGKVLEGLTKRRKAESDLFTKV